MVDRVQRSPRNTTSWLQAFRDITNATNERTLIAGGLPWCGIGHTAPIMDNVRGRSIACILVAANMNSLPLDWATRLFIGGVHMSYFLLKQIPVLSPNAYLKQSACGSQFVKLVVPRALELFYTDEGLAGFARDLGYNGLPFRWNEERRHCLQSELDAIFAHMYRLERAELEWILDAPTPSASFPSLKKNEEQKHGEYRTKRYVLDAYDQLQRGEVPNINTYTATTDQSPPGI